MTMNGPSGNPHVVGFIVLFLLAVLIISMCGGGCYYGGPIDSKQESEVKGWIEDGLLTDKEVYPKLDGGYISIDEYDNLSRKAKHRKAARQFGL